MPMFIIGILFFLFGFVTWLNGSLIPFLKVICSLSEFEALFVTFAFYIAYTVMAYPMSYILEITGYKKGMSLGLFVMMLGSLLFIPAALTGSFWVFLLALFVLGTGLTLLQSAANPYVVLLGPIESAARRISIMGLINKLAGVVAPIVFTVLIFSNLASLHDVGSADIDALAHQLILPYGVMALLLFVLVVFVYFSPLEEIVVENEDDCDDVSVFRIPQVVFGVIALFFYVGIEVIAGDTIGLYAQKIGMESATVLTSYTMVFMVLGYIVGVVTIPKLLSQRMALVLTSVVGMLFVLGVVFGSKQNHTVAEFLWGWSGVATLPDTITFVALLGFANALVWPTIWPLVLDGLGKHTAKASALLIMAIAGGALLPLLFGKIAQYSSMQEAYLVGIGCYSVIALYAVAYPKMHNHFRG